MAPNFAPAWWSGLVSLGSPLSYAQCRLIPPPLPILPGDPITGSDAVFLSAVPNRVPPWHPGREYRHGPSLPGHERALTVAERLEYR